MTLALAVGRKELAVWRHDPTVFVFLFAVPLFLAVLLTPALGVITGTDGAAQTVPGLTTLFGFYVMMFMGTAHYREHACGAWTVVRTMGFSRIGTASIVAGPYLALSLAQMATMLCLGTVVFGLSITGSVVGLALLICCTGWASIGIGLVLLTVTRNLSAMQNLSQIVVLVFGSVSGALMPFELLPDWAQVVGKITPQYWAVDGFKTVISGGGSIEAVLPNVFVLLGWAVATSIVAALWFDPGVQRRVPIR